MLDSAEATRTSQPPKCHAEHPQTPDNSPWAPSLRPPRGWPPLNCAGNLRETGIGSRTSKASGANMKGGGQCCAVWHLASTLAQSFSKGHTRKPCGTDRSWPHGLHTGLTSACRGRPANDEGSQPRRKALSWVSLSGLSASHPPTHRSKWAPEPQRGFSSNHVTWVK